MENFYLCPYCRGHLRVGDNIVFKIRNTLREKGLLLLHPEVGDYSSIVHPHFHFEDGERIDFFCPICMSSLDADLDQNLVQVLMVDSEGREQEVYFSRIAGEESTLQVSNEELMSTGMHSHRYKHFILLNENVSMA